MKVEWWVNDYERPELVEYTLEIDDEDLAYCDSDKPMPDEEKDSIIEKHVRDAFKQICWPEWEELNEDP